MPTKVSVGLSKKAGLPNYGSVEASCHVELELDAKILDGDPERFRLQVRRAYAARRDSFETELAQRTATPVNGDAEPNRPSMDRAHVVFLNRKRTATPGQLRVIEGIAARHGIDLRPMLDRLEVDAAEDLSVADASDLIAELQQQSGVSAKA